MDETAREREARLRRLAIQLTIGLPPDPDEARRVLDYARALLDGFIDAPLPAPVAEIDSAPTAENVTLLSRFRPIVPGILSLGCMIAQCPLLVGL